MSPSLRRLLLVLSGMLGVFVVAELTSRVVVSESSPAIRWYDASAQLKVEQMDDVADVDVVFAGTSMAWQAFVPAIFDDDTGLESYNAGLNGGTPEVMERWLVEEVVPRTQPTAVVWGLSSYDLAPAYGSQQRNAYDDAPETRTGALAAIDNRASDWSVLIRNRAVLRSVGDVTGREAEDRRREFDQADRTLGDDGERLDFDVDISSDRRDITRTRLTGFTPDPDDLLRISNTIRSLQRDGIEVILVQLPVPERFIDAHPNGASDYQTVAPALEALATMMQTRLLRLDDGFTDDDFVDFTHLTKPATSEFTEGFAAAYRVGRDDRGSDGEALPVDPPNETPGDDCATEIVVDEYGFKVEVQRCGDEPPPVFEEDPPDEVDVEIARRYVDELVEVFVMRPCREAFAESIPELSGKSAVDAAVAEARTALSETIELCGTPEFGAAWSQAISQLEIAASITRPVVDDASIPETASRTLSAISALRVQLAGKSPLTASHAWSQLDEIQSRRALVAADRSGAPVQTLAIGSSITLHGIDQLDMSAQLTDTFLNGAFGGGDPPVLEMAYPRLIEDIATPERVIWGITSHRLLTPTNGDCAALARPESQEFRAAMFPDLRDEFTDTELIFGPDLDDTPIDTGPVGESLDTRFDGPGDRERIPIDFRGIPSTVTRYPDPQLCPQMFESLERTIDLVRASGADLTMVVMPVHPDLIALAPESHAQALEMLEGLTSALGVDLFTIEQPLDDSETHDGWHPNGVGRMRLTADLIELLDL